MKYIKFKWNCDEALDQGLKKPLVGVSIKTASHCRPVSLILWYEDGSGIEVRSMMYDLAERTEVGVLDFRPVVNAAGYKELEIPKSFNGNLKLKKLTIKESGSTLESGFVLCSHDNNQLITVAGVYPYTLAIKGSLSNQPHLFEPEYPLDSYEWQDV